MNTSLFRRALIALTATAALTLTGCGGDDTAGSSTGPDSTSSSASGRTKETSPPASTDEVTIDVAIKGDDVAPVAQEADMEVGQTLIINVTSDRSGELHVHSSPEQQMNFPAGSSRLAITFDKPGQIDIEEHESDTLVARVLVQ